jgi:putative restriction endonuclease
MVGGAWRGTESIVLNGGYRDDHDLGDEITYTGYGGQDATGRQVRDQAWEQANQGMRVNEAEGLPLRVMLVGAGRSRPRP